MSRFEAARLTEAHEFDLIMPRPLDADDLAALAAVGADDFVIGESGGGRYALCFTRADPTLGGALISAIRDVQSHGLDVEDVRCHGMTGPDLSHPDVWTRLSPSS